ncbi:MAG: hypothetical protein GYA52_12250 [Chloroflexi bacterium]|nr:hypothetical protein [Chloroflexota bacterium]
MNNQHATIPSDRLSIISALIILNYAMMPFIYTAPTPLHFSLFGLIFDWRIKYADLLVLSAALFAAIGTYWLLYDHPNLNKGQIFIHLILPTLTAGAMSIPLNVISIGVAWWVVFAFGSILIILTLIAEYYSIDPHSSLFALARIILVPLAISLFLLLSISSRSAGYRLYLQVLLLGTLFSGIFTRLLALSGVHEKKKVILASTLLFVQALIACHYLPLRSVPFGMVLSGFVAFLTSLPFTQEPSKNILQTVRDAAWYALPFLAGALFFL